MNLVKLANDVRKDIIEMTYTAGVNGGHIGGALSCADILAVLYGKIMCLNDNLPDNVYRDRFILSKGHVALAHYAVLAECGLISKDCLATFEKTGSLLQTHEYMDISKGIEISGGSLGYGISVGVGIALAARMENKKFNIYVLVGDGECDEGCIWESVMSAVKYKLSNLTIIIDKNNQQLDGFNEDVMPISRIGDVFKSFGCKVINVNGNNVGELLGAFEEEVCDGPKVIVANTKKGAGIKSIEDKIGWHHACISESQYVEFLNELEEFKC